ncbi:hypothetical protein [Sphingomonas yantingensis]|uniref:Uncharacterized protein n=1 Tax=Sphingomonas yantingensis TaxID=1241761 RepID=A0A7W9AN57_9SPHN|nr:hypothetical protein [Sphingomonas yantingensis]MBB5697524.1 hypothetical protein [Sphingomonas yantingensis]
MNKLSIVPWICDLDPDRATVGRTIIYYPTLKLCVRFAGSKDLGGKTFSLTIDRDPLIDPSKLLVRRSDDERELMLRVPVLAELVDTLVPFKSNQSFRVTSLVMSYSIEERALTIRLESGITSLHISSGLLQRSPVGMSPLAAKAFLADATLALWHRLSGQDLDMTWDPSREDAPKEVRLLVDRSVRAFLGLSVLGEPSLHEWDLVAIRPIA